ADRPGAHPAPRPPSCRTIFSSPPVGSRARYGLLEADSARRASLLEQLEDAHEGLGIEPRPDAHRSSVGEKHLEAERGGLVPLGDAAPRENRGLRLGAPVQSPAPPV